MDEAAWVKGIARSTIGRGWRDVYRGQRPGVTSIITAMKCWMGIEKGLKPILPSVDQVLHALVHDLEQRGRLDNTLILMLGEFGRSPVMTKTAGRGHWTNVMSMVAAGGGLKHGQVIGATDRKGYDIQERPVTPSDLAATVFRFLGMNLEAHWVSPQGRPTPIVTEGGRPIGELFSETV